MSLLLSRSQLQHLSVGTLASVQRRWGALNEAQGAWLIKQGVSPEAILHPSPVGAARVKFDGGTFDVADTDGVGALTFRIANVEGRGIDLAAWSPRTGEIGSWYGRAFALGQDQINNPATFFGGGALRIHADPVAWLRAGRDGIVIIRPDRAYAMLRHVQRVSFANFDTAKKFEAWIKPPTPTVRMFVEASL